MRPLTISLCLLALLPVNPLRADDPEPTPRERALSQNNLKQIGLAFLNYHDANGSFPSNILDKNGKPLLSWRVAILPYIEQDALYKKFKLDEPWDSETNKKLAETIVKVYAPVRGTADKNKTFYQIPTGDGAIQNPKKKIKMANITDGLSYTLMVVEAADPVLWTKPEDVEFDAKKAAPKLGGLFNGDFNAVIGDGSVRLIKKGIDGDKLKALITIAGGETIKD